ncbi:MAG: hypothetical protein IJA34_00570 [Lachnospiraceae bacterium]|nr:hypothetical protein [Lachnospiraceae bacterium]
MNYFKIKIYVDNGVERSETWKYVIAKNITEAINRLLNYYNSQYDTVAKVLEIYDYPLTDVMIFSERLV